MNEFKEDADFYNDLGNEARDGGRFAEAKIHYERGIEVVEPFIGAEPLALDLFTILQYNIAVADYCDDQLKASSERLQKRLPYFEKKNSPLQLSKVYNLMCAIAADEGRFEDALGYCQKALTFARDTHLPQQIADTLLSLGNIEFRCKNFREAKWRLSEAIQIYMEDGSNIDLRGLAYCLEALSNAAVEEAHWDAASKMWGAAEFLRKKIEMPISPTEELGYESYLVKLSNATTPVDLAAWKKVGAEWSPNEAGDYAQDYCRDFVKIDTSKSLID